MADYLHGLGIGLINVIGVAVPGSLLMGFVTFGLFLPVICIALNVNGLDLLLRQAWPSPIVWAVFLVFATLSYVAGYILRLTSPNNLDKTSVEFRKKIKVPTPSIVRLGENRIMGVMGVYEEDRFPYLGLADFLKGVGHDDLLLLIPWGSTSSPPPPSSSKKCSVSYVNMWKNDIELFCPKLAAAVDSAEAHIRLMSGTWLAIRTAWWMVLAGLALALVAAACNIFLLHHHDATVTALDVFKQNSSYYRTQLFLNIFMLFAMRWGRRNIEKLFHPRRVGELLLILHAKQHADREAEKQKNKVFLAMVQ